MREYKFRGKSKRDGEWFYGNLYDKDAKGNTHICTLKKGCLVIDPDTVGQFTGLHDKNGKEIYEGDICKCDGVFKIIWYDDLCRFAVVSANGCLFYNVEKDSAKYWEVIGNCHDNPELLTT